MTAGYFVAGGTEYSVAGGAERTVTQNADCSAAGCTEDFVAGGTEYCVGAFQVGFACYHPSPLHALPHSCKWPMQSP